MHKLANFYMLSILPGVDHINCKRHNSQRCDAAIARACGACASRGRAARPDPNPLLFLLIHGLRTYTRLPCCGSLIRFTVDKGGNRSVVFPQSSACLKACGGPAR